MANDKLPEPPKEDPRITIYRRQDDGGVERREALTSEFVSKLKAEGWKEYPKE